MVVESKEDAVKFTAHNIRLDDGSYTIPESAHSMTDLSWFKSARGILDTVFPGDKSQIRVADVGCLEGGYAVEFARMGFQVLGIEIRDLNLAACRYVKSKVDLPHLEFVQDNALNIAQHGPFDAVFCCGLFYHLERPREYLDTLSAVTKKLLILQTNFSLISRRDRIFRLSTGVPWLTDRLLRRQVRTRFILSAPDKNEGLPGRWFTEFPTKQSFVKRDTARWASWDNRRSFWIQREHILQGIQEAGFDLVMEQYDNLKPNIAENLLGRRYQTDLRGTFIGIKTDGSNHN
jgi:ubiquinone/menaquinone biosynthesis C-methylase UbiE